MKTFSTIASVCLATALSSQAAFAKTYYIDALSGRDNFSGQSPTVSGVSGPWQTLDNLASPNLFEPGDVILLRCGHRWDTTLALRSSGTVSAPIKIGSYPAGCTTKPVIDGEKSIPESAWTTHSGQIRKVSLPANALINGAFTSTASGWSRWSENGDAAMSIVSSCPDATGSCLRFSAGSGNSALLISNKFSLDAMRRYRVTFSIRAEAGKRIGAYVRRADSTFAWLGLSAEAVTAGGWQTLSFDFVSRDSVDNARFDLQVPGRGTVVHVKNMAVSRAEYEGLDSLQTLAEHGVIRAVAHHPNRGFNPTLPDSNYYLTASSSSIILKPDGRQGSPFLRMGSDVVLPAGAQITPGTQLVLKSQTWSIEKHKVTSVNGNQLNFEPASAYPLTFPGWGYFFTGALWMLDKPSEWIFDAPTKQLYYWPQATSNPAIRVAYSTLSKAVDLVDQSYINLEGLSLQNAGVGLDVTRSLGVNAENITISNVAMFGVESVNANKFSLTNSVVIDSGSDALHGIGSEGALVSNNLILNSGVAFGSDGLSNIPGPSYGALVVGDNSRVLHNRIYNTSYIGISAGSGSVVKQNIVHSHCYFQNDCGGIYLSGNTNSVIEENLIVDGVGNRHGIPGVLPSLVDGIYLDFGNSSVSISNNYIKGSDYGVVFHNGNNNSVSENLIYGTRLNGIWLQETGSDQRSTGNIFDNQILRNALFATSSSAALRNVARVENTSDFGIFDGNQYSGIVNPVVAQESMPGSSISYLFPDWQLARTPQNIARNLEANGRLAAPVAGRALGRMGATIIANGNVAVDTTGWSSHSSTQPAPVIQKTNCSPETLHCLLLTAGGGASDLYTPRFDVVKGQIYRVTFDAKMDEEGRNVTLLARRAGPTNYASVMGGDPITFRSSTSLKRFSFPFVATETVTRSASSSGVRVDFSGIPAGKKLWVGNFEIVPIGQPGEVRHDFIANIWSDGNSSHDCPTRLNTPALCDSYYGFPSGEKVTWPLVLGRAQAAVVFTQSSLLDSDLDGVANEQDLCGNTPAGKVANSKGCALGQ